MNIDDLVQYHILKMKASITGASLYSAIEDQLEQSAELRQMCAKVHPVVYERLNEVTDFLGISKRQFIELAVIDATNRAMASIESSGVMTLEAEIDQALKVQQGGR